MRYQVVVSDPSPRTVHVVAEISGAPRDSLVLNGFGGTDVLRISEVSASGPSGTPVPVALVFDSTTADGTPIRVPRVVVRGPLPSRLTVRYRVDPGTRAGDSHMGFTGTRYGYLGPTFGLFSGRSLFLLPGHGESVGSIAVRFALPAGWRALAPWRLEGGWLRPDVGGRYGAEHLIAGTVGVGPWVEHPMTVGRTRFRLAFAPGVSEPQIVQAREAVAQATRRIHGLIGRDLGPDYLVLAAPTAPDGDEIRCEAWGLGQGLTLAPITAGRLHRYATSLLEAYLKYAPYRIEVHSPDEYWIVDGISKLYGWRAVAAAGMADEAEVERELAGSYLSARHVQGSVHDLETLYATKLPTDLLSGVEAPFELAYLDRTIRSESAGKDSLDPVLTAMFRRSPAASLWASLPKQSGAGWERFRARYVRGVDAIPAAAAFGVVPATPLPTPPAGPPKRHVLIAFTGDTQGFLEHCGCKVNQSGGVARRATAVERLRREHPGILLLDVGNAFLRPEKNVSLDFLSRAEQRLYLETMEKMRYDAMAIGMTELTFGPAWFREAGRGLRLPYVCANIREGGGPLAPGSVVVRSQGARIGVIAVFEPPSGPKSTDLFEANTTHVRYVDPVRAVQDEVARLEGRADLLVVIGRISPAMIRRIASACPSVDLILSNATEGTELIRAENGGAGQPQNAQGFLGRTLVLYEDSRNYGLETVDLGVDAEAHFAGARTTHLWLYEDVPDDPAYRGMLTRFYQRVGKLDQAQATVQPLFASSAERQQGLYVGAAHCRSCHEPEYAQWKTTRHATAYKTLLDAHRHYQPHCVVCHVVGFRTRTGYHLGDPEEPLANVQCEVCHGPGGEHAEDPDAHRMTRAVPETICLECHNPEHSDRFVYAEKVPLVRHDASGAGRATTAGR